MRILLFSLVLVLTLSPKQVQAQSDAEMVGLFMGLVTDDNVAIDKGLNHIESNWNDEFLPILADILYLTSNKTLEHQLETIISNNVTVENPSVFFKWYSYLWESEANYPSYYADFKAELFQLIDPKFGPYFKDRADEINIRLDEVLWGGVFQDGIPPLRYPKMLESSKATYLNDSNVVFGIELNGDVRAYPKRILAWHEMFVDSIGGKLVTGVYCTLCGTVIPYDSELEGERYDLGTSGFLYRSNKLMYDKKTQSLWNTIEGKPVIGPLAGKDIELNTFAMVTTTWGEWRKRHPNTQVLSLDTGHDRNYDEGNAYNSYFSNDVLMFQVPKSDKRLKNKAEVLVIRTEGYKDDPLAISATYLKSNKVYQDKIGDIGFVVLTDASGGNRVYEDDGLTFKKFKGGSVKDSEGNSWKVFESHLESEDGRRLESLSYHRIFWFAWFNAYPQTRLVQ